MLMLRGMLITSWSSLDQPPASVLGKCCFMFVLPNPVMLIHCVGYWRCRLLGRPHGPRNRWIYAVVLHTTVVVDALLSSVAE
jgi:hypothetical protein